MLLPSFETSRSASLSRQKNNVGNDSFLTAKQTTIEDQIKPAFQHPKIKIINDKTTEQKKSSEILPALNDEVISSNEASSSLPDYTLALSELSNQTSVSLIPAADLKPDEIRFGRKRPDLPITFSFGIRRSQAVAVAMRYPLLEGKQPTTAAQAILDTLDLAATNRLPYVKGARIHIAA